MYETPTDGSQRRLRRGECPSEDPIVPRLGMVEYTPNPAKPAPKFYYWDFSNIHSKMKHLHVGGTTVFENVEGALLLEVLKKHRNYRAELIDHTGHQATICASTNGKDIYVRTKGFFTHAPSYKAYEVTVAEAKYNEKWFEVYSLLFNYGFRVIFPKVKFTRLHFWQRVKPPKVI